MPPGQGGDRSAGEEVRLAGAYGRIRAELPLLEERLIAARLTSMTSARHSSTVSTGPAAHQVDYRG